MRRTNRVEPVCIDGRSLVHAVMITTTELEIIRRVEITPFTESIVDRIRCPSAASMRSSRKVFWCIGCLFLTAGILALSIVITGFTIVFGRMKMMRKSNIERYDLGDLHYGINNVNYPSNTYLSNINKVFIQNYLSDQLLTESGYRGLMIDEIFLRDKLHSNKRKQRDTTCSIVLIIENTQVYFDHCPTCTSERNSLLRRLFFNRTAFQEPFYLLLNSQYLFAPICSTPNISHLITPTRMDLSDIEKINTHRQSTPPQIDFEIHKDISTDVSTETTLIENLASFSTDHSTIITSPDSIQIPETSSLDPQTSRYTTESSIFSSDPQTSSYTSESPIFSSDSQTFSYTRESSIAPRKTTASMFQFLPFKPPSTISSWQSARSLSPLINTTINRQRINPHG